MATKVAGLDDNDKLYPAQLPNGVLTAEGGVEGQVLKRTADGQAWGEAPDPLPEGATPGQVLTAGAVGPQWSDLPEPPASITPDPNDPGTFLIGGAA